MGRFSKWIDTFGSAVRVAAAADNGRKANRRDLIELGIDPVQFRSVQR